MSSSGSSSSSNSTTAHSKFTSAHASAVDWCGPWLRLSLRLSCMQPKWGRGRRGVATRFGNSDLQSSSKIKRSGSNWAWLWHCHQLPPNANILWHVCVNMSVCKSTYEYVHRWLVMSRLLARNVCRLRHLLIQLRYSHHKAQKLKVHVRL